MYIIDLKKKKSGPYMGVLFAGGRGETDSEYLAERFKEKGFEVEIADYSPMLLPLEELEKLPPEQLLDYAKVHQVDTGKATSAAGILEKITEAGKVFTKTEE